MTLRNRIKCRNALKSVITINEVMDDDPNLSDAIQVHRDRNFETVSRPYKLMAEEVLFRLFFVFYFSIVLTAVFYWTILKSFVYVFWAPLKMLTYFTRAIILILQIFAQTMQSVLDGSFFEKNPLPDADLVVSYENVKYSRFFRDLKEDFMDSENLKILLNGIHRWVSNVESKTQAVTNVNGNPHR